MTRVVRVTLWLLLGFVISPVDLVVADDSIVIENVTNDQGVKGVRGTFLLTASREQIWDIFTNYDRFRETFTRVRDLKVLNQDENGALVQFKIRVAFLPFEYTLQRDYVRQGELLSWRRTEGDFQHISGSWQILPGPREGVHKVVFEAFVDVVFLVPTAMVRDRAAKELRKTIKRMRERLAASDT